METPNLHTFFPQFALNWMCKTANSIIGLRYGPNLHTPGARRLSLEHLSPRSKHRQAIWSDFGASFPPPVLDYRLLFYAWLAQGLSNNNLITNAGHVLHWRRCFIAAPQKVHPATSYPSRIDWSPIDGTRPNFRPKAPNNEILIVATT